MRRSLAVIALSAGVLASREARAGDMDPTPERFVTQPILLPQKKFFPDAWNRSARGAYRLVRRLMVYADLEGDARVHLFETGGHTHVDADGKSYEEGPEHALATFHGKEDDLYVFGLDVAKLDDDETLSASMCHEVAHAFRMTKGLEVATVDIEEQLTDLTTIYLGFGVLTTSASYRYRTHGGYANLVVQASGAGYLGPSAMSFLLAVQAVARGGYMRMASSLEANQADLFERAVTELLPDRAKLLVQLGLPDESTWPPPKPLSDFLGPIDMAREAELDERPPVKVAVGRSVNKGKPVFRVRHRRMFLPVLLCTLVAGIGARVVDMGDAVLWFCLVGVGVGVVVGWKRLGYTCSDSDCEAALTIYDERCPNCHGVVAGTIASQSQRLDALDAYERGAFKSLD